MFPRRSLDLMVLSILAENVNAKGINAYALIKAFRERFPPIATPSPGTIYPLLEKLTKNGDTKKDDSVDPPIFTITSEGKKKLSDGIPDILNDSLESLPTILQTLLRNLPFNTRIQFMSDFPQTFCSCKSCYPLEDEFEDLDAIQGPPSVQIGRLNKIKDSYEVSKKRIQEWSQAEITNIDNRIQKIEEKIKKIETDRSKWKTIPID
jgi:DNA-binding PadR family transcriptional regulator